MTLATPDLTEEEVAVGGDDTVLKCSELVVGYNGQPLLPPITMTLKREETWALFGRNGSGKTTLLKTLLGLLPGVRGQSTFSPGVRVGYVPQRQSLTPAVPGRVRDVVMGGLDTGLSFMNPLLPWKHRSAVQKVLEELNIADLSSQQFWTLSEGQKQRALIARALVGNPSLMVLDEPTSAMDLVAETATYSLLKQLQRSRGLALLVVSHQLAALAENASHALMVDRDAQIVLVGEVNDVIADARFAQRYGETVSQSLLARSVNDSALAS